MTSLVQQLQTWFSNQCNGEWEHAFGIKIETLDNPGWRLEIQLTNTDLQDKPFDELAVEREGLDWIRCRVSDGVFEGFGGAQNLAELLETFLQWANDAKLK
jgi:hypothetical protein